jgi:hypothetical protein
MGKKRTSAAKKKQVAKKKKLSSAYGVSVLKGSTVSRNNGVIDANFASPVGANTNSHVKNPIRTLAHGDDGRATSINNSATTLKGNQKKSADATIMQPREISAQRLRVNHSENDEFHRLHASLEERSMALQARNNELCQRKKIRLQQQKKTKKGWGANFAQPLVTTNFAEATLTLAPKTTQELVDDATNHVARGMSEIGQSVASNLLTSMSGQSSLAAAAGLDWKLRAYESSNMQTKQSNASPQLQHPNNPFAAFESDSDNEWTDKADDKPNSVQRFQFQPASFSFQPDVPQIALDDDIDPDL